MESGQLSTSMYVYECDASNDDDDEDDYYDNVKLVILIPRVPLYPSLVFINGKKQL